MAEKSKFLLATGAVCVLALTACGNGGSGNGGGESASPTPVVAPDDYTLETAESTLAAATVNGEELTGVAPAGDALGGAESEDAQSMLQMIMSMVESDPTECKDPLFTAISAGTMDGNGLSPNLADMVGGTNADDMTVSVRVMDSRDAADQAVKDLESSLGDCENVTLSVMGDETTVDSSTSNPDVEGAGETLVLSGAGATGGATGGATASPSPTAAGETTFSSGVMSVGNLVVMVAPGNGISVVEGDTGSATPASEQELQSALADVATAFVDGPVEPTGSASPTDTASPSPTQS